jgi:hypothetical protein
MRFVILALDLCHRRAPVVGWGWQHRRNSEKRALVDEHANCKDRLDWTPQGVKDISDLSVDRQICPRKNAEASSRSSPISMSNRSSTISCPILKNLTGYHLIQMRYQKPERHHTNSRRHEANNSLPLLDYCVLAIELKPDSGSRGLLHRC